MIAFLTGLGASPRIAKAIAYAGVPLLILAALWWALDSYGDSRYDAGHEAADKEWQEASDRLIEKSQAAGTKADKAAAARQADFAAKQEDEKEKVHDALEEGSSPLDALFPGE
jgi:hypothetical protein